MSQTKLSEILQALRAREGWTLSQAAEKAQIDRHTLRDLERGTRAPYLPTLLKVAQAYNVDVDLLLGQAGAVRISGAAGLEADLPINSHRLEDVFNRALEKWMDHAAGLSALPVYIEEELVAALEDRSEADLRGLSRELNIALTRIGSTSRADRAPSTNAELGSIMLNASAVVAALAAKTSEASDTGAGGVVEVLGIEP